MSVISTSNHLADYLDFLGIVCAESYILKANGTSLSIFNPQSNYATVQMRA
ncbi:MULTISPECIES: hypothetical protein [Pediococcus]|jgi:hypothetical protein|uniref:hypothetical protein n=1 Tax=Pediococcus TaxID=1253 RepID=UPI0007161549|nr:MULTISPECIES: hypothetical protein [Pediococcus]MDN5575432.1 hypothetical protein [Pediococcus sp.]GEL89784.1 hypothetical protein PPA04_10150 [Pediococcus parvulus]GHC11369.1 hypothetical protein GCM10008912_13650 [Pediococcus parvulus]